MAEKETLQEAPDRRSAGPPVVQHAVVSTPEVCGGKPRLYETRIPVWGLVKARQIGLKDHQILEMYPSLDSEHLRVAWDYYEHHKDAIDRQIEEEDW